MALEGTFRARPSMSSMSRLAFKVVLNSLRRLVRRFTRSLFCTFKVSTFAFATSKVFCSATFSAARCLAGAGHGKIANHLLLHQDSFILDLDDLVLGRFQIILQLGYLVRQVDEGLVAIAVELGDSSGQDRPGDRRQ